MTDRRENRVKIFHVEPDRLLVPLFQSFSDERCAMFSVPVLESPGVPEGAIVERVWYEPCSHMMCVAVWHDSFDIVLAGNHMPRGDQFSTMVTWIENGAYAQELDEQNLRAERKRDALLKEVRELEDRRRELLVDTTSVERNAKGA